MFAQSDPLDSPKRLLLAARNAHRVRNLTVNAAHLLKLPPSSRESLGLGDHVSCPLLGVSKEHGAKSLLAVVTSTSPTAPYALANLNRSAMALLPPHANGGVQLESDCGNAPMIPVIPHNVGGPEKIVDVPCVDV